jgi:dTDP-4-amino-4,6-dideoxygalactose transaminase
VNRDTVEEFWDEDTVTSCYDGAARVTVAEFVNQFGCFLGVSSPIWATRSGRDALRQFLVDAVLPSRRSVLLCSFNCSVVADAVLAAGYQVETFDLADCTGRIDWECVADQLKLHHGALVVPHLFGVPSDFRPILRTAEKLGVWVVEDCAQTLDGRIETAKAGILGDAAIFSFNYDKPISLGGGGALLVNNPDLESKIRIRQSEISLETDAREIALVTEYLQKRRRSIRHQGMRLVSRAWNRAARVLFRSAKEPFPVSGIGPLRACLGLWQLARYPAVKQQRNKHASVFSIGTNGKSWHTDPSVHPAWLRQKVVPARPDNIRAIERDLQKRGIRVGIFNWSKTLDEYLGLPGRPNASYVAKHSLDIPIHQNMTASELQFILETVCRMK